VCVYRSYETLNLHTLLQLVRIEVLNDLFYDNSNELFFISPALIHVEIFANFDQEFDQERCTLLIGNHDTTVKIKAI
jgi:hypothetical protein